MYFLQFVFDSVGVDCDEAAVQSECYAVFYVFLMMIISHLCIKRLEKAFAKELQSDYGFPGSLD